MDLQQIVLLGLGATAVVVYFHSSFQYTGGYIVKEGEGVNWDANLISQYQGQFGGPHAGRFPVIIDNAAVAQQLINQCESGSLAACQDYQKFFGGTFTRAE